MTKQSVLTTIFLLILSNIVFGQVNGIVSDVNGDPLPYVSVFVEGTSRGTVTNEKGEYSLQLEDGNYNLSARFVGYRSVTKNVNHNNQSTINFQLEEDVLELDEITVTANGEDPAYRVIRAAIKAREKHNLDLKKHSVDLYVKGLVRMLDTPDKILGQEVGDMGGMLDSLGTGIVYLAESQSHLYFHQPDLVKEVMYSSKIAEDDSGFNFNRFLGTNYDIYDEYFEFNRTLINPLADQAFTHYRYQLLEATVNDKGQLINRIKVIPKSRTSATVFGTLYIMEDTWVVTELDLSFTGKAIQQQIFDTVRIRQIHLPLKGDHWLLFSQVYDFTLGGFGFKVGGSFNYIFSNYDLDPDFDRSLFTSETFKMTEDAIRNDTAFWSEVRPIQLTEEEQENYIKKDSLKKVWKSREYMDSLDRKNNKFVLGDLLFGYSYAKRYNNFYLSFDSPLSTYRFNPIEGSSIGSGLNISKSDSLDVRTWIADVEFDYGFADRRLKYDAEIKYRYNKVRQEQIKIEAGDSYSQLNEYNPVLDVTSTYQGLVNKENPAKLFRQKYVGVDYKREIINGLYGFVGVSYQERSPLQLNTDYSLFNKDNFYETNHPNGELPSLFFNIHNHAEFWAAIRIKPFQKYSSYPGFRLREESNWPDLIVYYDKGLAAGDTDYDRLRLTIEKDDINWRLYGTSSIHIKGGMFLNKNRIEYMDLHHFYSNSSIFAYASRYTKGYKLMPHYVYSTSNDYVSTFFEHSFDGFIMNKLPFLKDLDWSFVISANSLIRDRQSNYYEASIGIKGFKIGVVELFRLDYIWNFHNRDFMDSGLVIGMSTIFGT